MPREIVLFPGASLLTGRVHEALGPGRLIFAAAVMGRAGRPCLWIDADPRHAQILSPEGLAAVGAIPPRAVVRVPSHRDALWTAEEALRSPARLTVVADLTKPLDLTASRRLQLAAEAGGGLGLFLVPEGGGATAAETRWFCEPLWDEGKFGGEGDSTLARWALIKNKKGTIAAWGVALDGATHRFTVVAASADGSNAAVGAARN